MEEVTERAIREFWDTHPCGESQVESLNADHEEFFQRYDAFCYSLYLAQAKGSGIIGGHIENARKMGLWEYLKMSNFIHANADGPSNPYSKAYDLSAVKKDFLVSCWRRAIRITCMLRLSLYRF